MCVQAWFRNGPQHRHNWKQTTSTFSGALLKQGLWVQLWSHLSCDGRDESGCKLTGNEGLYKWTWRIYKSPDNLCTGQLSLQGTESTEWIWTWNALQKPMLFFWSINISVLWLLNIYPLCPPARSPNLSQKTDSKKGRKGQERTILFEPQSQFPGDFCLPLTFHVLQLADEMDTLFYTGKNWLLSLRLPIPFKHGLTPNVTLSSKHHPGPVPAGECQTVRCKALHPLKALHFKQSLWLFLYTACDMKATSPKPFTSLITIYFSFFC